MTTTWSWPRTATNRRQALGLLAAGVAAAVAGCGQDPAEFTGIGTITLATPPDFSLGAQRREAVKEWTADRPGQNADFIELPRTADGQHTQLVSRLQEGSAGYDVVGIDVTWTDEFARNGHILPLDAVEEDLMPDRFLHAAWETGRYRDRALGLWPRDRLFAVPLHTNVGLLYYRTDVGGLPTDWQPTSWGEVEDRARRYRDSGLDGFIGQLDSYEGLVVNLAEVVWGHGGDLVDGDRVTVQEDGTIAGLGFLLRGLGEEWIPRAALGYDEEASRVRFQEGNAGLLRNWPYAYARFEEEGSPVKGRFGVAPLPGPNALGGANLAIVTSCENKETARRLVRFLTNEETQRSSFAGGGYPPSVSAAYRRPDRPGPGPDLPEPLIKAIDDSSGRARPRARTPYYQQVSRVIQRSVHESLSEGHDAKDTMSQLARPLEAALRGH